MQRTGLITIAIFALIIAGAAFFAFDRANDDGQVRSEAMRALSNADGAFTDLEQKPIDLTSHEGKVRVVNSWATWCPFCVNELPDFAQLSEEFSEDVAVIAINRAESNETARSFISSLEEVGDIIFVQDSDDVFYDRIGGFSMPETVFYDRDGNVSFHKRGFMTLEEMRGHTRDALGASEELPK